MRTRNHSRDDLETRPKAVVGGVVTMVAMLCLLLGHLLAQTEMKVGDLPEFEHNIAHKYLINSSGGFIMYGLGIAVVYTITYKVHAFHYHHCKRIENNKEARMFTGA